VACPVGAAPGMVGVLAAGVPGPGVVGAGADVGTGGPGVTTRSAGALGPDGAASQAKRSSLVRTRTSPSGPRTQVRWPSVNATRPSAFRHTSRPLVVRCSVSPEVASVRSFSVQSPITSGTALFASAKPCVKRQPAGCGRPRARAIRSASLRSGVVTAGAEPGSKLETRPHDASARVSVVRTKIWRARRGRGSSVRST
jgi:hypothetical protein